MPKRGLNMFYIERDQKNYDKQVYDLAKEFLLNVQVQNAKPITCELLEEYLKGEPRPITITISDIYERILESAKNANMKSGVIGGSIDGVANLKNVLCDFKPQAIIQKYGNNWEQVFQDIQRQVKPRGQINSGPQGLWPRYCKTILSSARFMAQFTSAEGFCAWVDLFDYNDRTRPALPLLLQSEIYGFGLALACDFLMELGYLKFAKPDVHLRRIFTSLELCPPTADDYQLLNAIIRVANNAGVTPHNADKLFWLIGSGNFFRHKIKRADEFIKYVHQISQH